jgi:hypothetical protein
MSTQEVDRLLAGPLYGKEPWPLRFYTHSFSAACFNTLACSLIYNWREFGTRRVDSYGNVIDGPSGSPPANDWMAHWDGSNIIPIKEGKTFPTPVTVKWTSLDGEGHEAVIDLDELFEERLVLHNVARDEVLENWLEARKYEPLSPGILVLLNDRTLKVFMRALVFTAHEQVIGSVSRRSRNDLIEAWSRTY